MSLHEPSDGMMCGVMNPQIGMLRSEFGTVKLSSLMNKQCAEPVRTLRSGNRCLGRSSSVDLLQLITRDDFSCCRTGSNCSR